MKWTKEGIAEAVKMLLKENTPLFDSMVKQLGIYRYAGFDRADFVPGEADFV